MELDQLLLQITALPSDELIRLKRSVITKIDRHRYAKDVLSKMDKDDAEKTIEWIKQRYKI